VLCVDMLCQLINIQGASGLKGVKCKYLSGDQVTRHSISEALTVHVFLNIGVYIRG